MACDDVKSYFGPRVYQRGSLVIALVRWSVRGPSVRPSLNISKTVHWFFLVFCMKLEHHKGTKVTEPDLKKNLGVTNNNDNNTGLTTAFMTG